MAPTQRYAAGLKPPALAVKRVGPDRLVGGARGNLRVGAENRPVASTWWSVSLVFGRAVCVCTAR